MQKDYGIVKKQVLFVYFNQNKKNKTNKRATNKVP